MSMEEAIKREIGETAGYVSLCWEPKPTGVFDSETAARAVEESVARLYAEHVAALRACEQIDRGYLRGYVDGLDDAREAVLEAKAIDVYYGRGLDEPPQFIWLNNAISAIDALREKR